MGARVVALAPDLMFGSKLLAALEGAGYEVQLVQTVDGAVAAAQGADVLVADLAAGDVDAAQLLAALPEGVGRTLACYSHVDADARAAAQAAGFTLVVPRSRLHREAPALVRSLLDG